MIRGPSSIHLGSHLSSDNLSSSTINLSNNLMTIGNHINNSNILHIASSIIITIITVIANRNSIISITRNSGVAIMANSPHTTNTIPLPAFPLLKRSFIREILLPINQHLIIPHPHTSSIAAINLILTHIMAKTFMNSMLRGSHTETDPKTSSVLLSPRRSQNT